MKWLFTSAESSDKISKSAVGVEHTWEKSRYFKNLALYIYFLMRLFSVYVRWSIRSLVKVLNWGQATVIAVKISNNKNNKHMKTN